MSMLPMTDSLHGCIGMSSYPCISLVFPVLLCYLDLVFPILSIVGFRNVFYLLVLMVLPLITLLSWLFVIGVYSCLFLPVWRSLFAFNTGLRALKGQCQKMVDYK